jgi:bacteriocin-like protein
MIDRCDKAEKELIGQELTEQELDKVSGGLNPQPLPPRWSVSMLSALKVHRFLPPSPC